MRFLLAFLGFLLLFSCQDGEESSSPLQQYFPVTPSNQQEIVNKYYVHYKAADSYDTRTNIEYQHYQQTKEGGLQLTDYDAGFEMESINSYQFTGAKMIHKERQWYLRGDTIENSILQPVFMDWEQDTTTYQRTEYFDWGERTWLFQQLTQRDTIIEERAAKVFEGSMTLTVLQKEKEEKTYSFRYQKSYVSGIGLFHLEQTSEQGRLKIELVEQLPFKSFSEQANHQLHRVAYIDSDKVLDKDNNLQLCDTQQEIFDYYNGTPDAGFNGGKGALKLALLPKIDSKLLYEESGYLTFRFVINCNGETGWFVTEQADLDFQVKQFPEATIQHLFELIVDLDTWHPTIIRGEARDAYAYLTIKLKDGEITDFLP